jgi:hypothetical protein
VKAEHPLEIDFGCHAKIAQQVVVVQYRFQATLSSMPDMITVEGINTLWWAVSLYLIVRLVKEPSPPRWLLLGGVSGIALLTRYAIGFLNYFFW